MNDLVRILALAAIAWAILMTISYRTEHRRRKAAEVRAKNNQAAADALVDIIEGRLEIEEEIEDATSGTIHDSVDAWVRDNSEDDAS